MTSRVKLFSLQCPRSWYQPTYATEGDAADAALGKVGKHLLASEWRTRRLRWTSSAARARRPTITSYLGFPCIRTGDVTLLGLRVGAQTELLAVTIDEEPWAIVNSTYRAQGFDPLTSIPKYSSMSPDGTPYWFDWFNTTDPRVLDVHVFTASQTGGCPLVVQSFVDEVRRAKLHGVRFEHHGYWVANYCDALPRPEPRRRAAGALAATVTPVPTLAPLPTAIKLALADAGSRTAKRLGLSESTDAASTLRALEAELSISSARLPMLGPLAKLELLQGLSWIFGNLICQTQGWIWAELHQGDDQHWPTVASATGQYALPMLPYIQAQVESGASTATVLFKLITAGHLPPPRPGHVVVLR